MFPSAKLLSPLALAALLPVIASAQTNRITGAVTNSTTWSGTNLLFGTVTIQTGVVVNIDPGTTMLMSNAATLVINGQLLANGTSNAPVLFTRAVAGQTWSRLRFVRAQASLLRHCTVEFANSAGTHLDYYDNDCNTNTVPPNRTYHEAIVALATHLDVDSCLFRNLPDTGAAAEGDALAIISDDPQMPGPASAHIHNCQFPSIGQAIHTRHAYVLVEGCTFSGKRGDNDDVDLYGESTPPPVIRFNTFLPGHEDKINPTRCSAIIYGNIVSGSDDHGIVLRDRGRPVVFNNVIFNCTSAGISVQNQCDALIANNTIFNSARGIRFFDHFDRAVPPYCLFRGSGRATILNCLIWNVTTPLELTDSTNGHSMATIAWSDVRGAQSSLSISANSTLVWGAGNINLNPQCLNTNPIAPLNFRLQSGSPCIDAGTNVGAFVTNLSVIVSNDFEGVPRPLDGNGNGTAQYDIGAYEFLLPTADSNGDGIPDGWTWQHRLDPTSPDTASANPDNDPHTTLEEWFADTNPVNALSFLRITAFSNAPAATVHFLSSSNRLYTLFAATNLTGENTLQPVPGQIDIPGTGGPRTLLDTNAAPEKFYRVRARVP